MTTWNRRCGRNCEESGANGGAVESQRQAFHRSLEIPQTEIPTCSQLRRRCFYGTAEALKQSTERFKLLAEAIPQIVWTQPPDGTVDYLNQRSLRNRGR